MVAVGLDPQREALDVELGVELGRVDVRADPEGLDGAGRRRRQPHGPRRQLAHRLLVAEEDVEGVGQGGQQRVGAALVGERHLDGADRFAVGAVDHAAAGAAEDADAVAGAEEGRVGRDHLVGEPGEVGLRAPLLGRLLHDRVADVEGAAAEAEAGPVVEVDGAELVALEPPAVQLRLVETGTAQDGGVLVVGRVVLRARAEEEERLHGCPLMTAPLRPSRSGPRRRRSPRR